MAAPVTDANRDAGSVEVARQPPPAPADGPALHAHLLAAHLTSGSSGLELEAALQACADAAAWLRAFSPRAAAWLRDGGKTTSPESATLLDAREAGQSRSNSVSDGDAGAAAAAPEARLRAYRALAVAAFRASVAADVGVGDALPAFVAAVCTLRNRTPKAVNPALALLPFFLPQHVMPGALHLNRLYTFAAPADVAAAMADAGIAEPRPPAFCTPLQFACAGAYLFAVRALCDPIFADPLLFDGGAGGGPLNANVYGFGAIDSAAPRNGGVMLALEARSPLQLLLATGAHWRHDALPRVVDALLSRSRADVIRGWVVYPHDDSQKPPLWVCAQQCVGSAINGFARLSTQVGVRALEQFMRRHDPDTDDGDVDLLQPHYRPGSYPALVTAELASKAAPPPATVLALIGDGVRDAAMGHVARLHDALKRQCERIVAYRTRAPRVVADALLDATVGLHPPELVALVVAYAVRPVPVGRTGL